MLPKKIEAQASLLVVKFYFAVCRKFLFTTLILMVLGFVSRVLLILQFVLVIKVFLSIFDPTMATNLISVLLNMMGFSVEELDRDFVLKFLFTLLSIIVCIQYALARFNLALLCTFKENALSSLFKLPLNINVEQNKHLCFDYIQHGLEATVKSGEIIVFYVTLIFVIFYLSPLLGVLVVLFVPPLFVLLLYKNRKEVHIQLQIMEARKKITDLDQDIRSPLGLISQHYRLVRSSLINSEFGSGLTLVAIMIVFSTRFDNLQLTALSTLMLVFCLRFVITYAGELSRFINRLLQLRTKLALITEVDPRYPFGR